MLCGHSRIIEGSPGHWQDAVIRTLNHWTPSPLDSAGLQELRGKRAEHHHSVMISGKSANPVCDIRKVFV